jgi:Cd2+/Zn2+-exporting ATPase
MERTQEASLPLPPAVPGREEPCIALVEAAFRQESGVHGAVLDLSGRRLQVRYDPRRVSLPRLERVARQLGLDLGQCYERCTRRLQGLGCTECLEGLRRRLEASPGVARVEVNPAAATVVVDYRPDADDAAIDRVIDRAGYDAAPVPRGRAALAAARAGEAAARRRMAIFTALCFAGWLLGLVSAWSGVVPWPVVLALYVVGYAAGGFVSTVRAVRQLRGGTVGVDLLMITAAAGAAVVGAWPEGAFLLFLFSLSNTLEQYVLGRTRRAIEALMDLSPEEAVVRRDGREERVAVEDLQPGNVLIVRPGERIAADGLILAGRTSVDQSAMTGESLPVEKQPGDPVFAATLNQQGAVEVRVTRRAGQSALARVVQLVEEAQSAKAQSQRFTDWFGGRYTVGVLAASALVLSVPWLLWAEPFAQAFYRAMTFLVAASPCAVVISIPAAILAAITGAARGGVLFKGGAHLERAADVRAIAFDKTGTLTVGKPQLVDLCPAEGVDAEERLRLAAAAEQLSEHPLANAVVEAARARGLTPQAAGDLEALVGRGIRARVGERTVWVGKPRLFADRGVGIPPSLETEAGRLAAQGKTVLFVGDDAAVLGVLAVADTLRPGAEEAVGQLRELGIERQVILTGDNPVVAAAIAGRLGLDFEAELLPEHKLAAVHTLRARYETVAMVGDGINDAPSLAAASLGVSLGGSGTDVALETADVVLMGDDLRNRAGTAGPAGDPAEPALRVRRHGGPDGGHLRVRSSLAFGGGRTRGEHGTGDLQRAAVAGVSRCANGAPGVSGYGTGTPGVRCEPFPSTRKNCIVRLP